MNPNSPIEITQQVIDWLRPGTTPVSRDTARARNAWSGQDARKEDNTGPDRIDKCILV